MKRILFLLIALALVAVTLSSTIGLLSKQSTPVISPMITGRVGTVVLDAGHGGEDGGAVSITGVAESTINLAIVLKLDDLFGFCGVAPIVLRDTNRSLHDETAITLREKKVSDLKNRVATIEAAQGATLLSIHQNTYPNGRYHGTHVFYAPTEGSAALAQAIQSAVQKQLQLDNKRQPTKITDNVYLMNHITRPGVLVECGFLTNPQEEALLRDEDYQRKLVAVLVATCLTTPVVQPEVVY